VRVDDQILTGGQPLEDQLRAAAEEGVQVVINLATLDPRYSLPDEGGLAQSLGLQYHHLPVDWNNPAPEDFDAFAQIMDGLGGRHVFIHCAANFRVTAFYGLYAIRSLGWTAAQADALRARVWGHHQYPVWEAYIKNMKASLAPQSPSNRT
jgi:protein tyrosine phosphatase (PTP) superfamily phosphohydrolase (DUF442 family)